MSFIFSGTPCMLGGNLGSLLYGDVSVMRVFVWYTTFLSRKKKHICAQLLSLKYFTIFDKKTYLCTIAFVKIFHYF